MVAVFGDVAVLTDGHHGCAQVLDLAAEVVEVVLAGDGVACGGEDAAEQVAGECAAGVADVERPGWVGRDELDVDVLRVGGGDVAPSGGFAEDASGRRGEPAVRNADVQEAGWRDVDGGDGRVGVRGGRDDVRGDRSGDLHWRAAVRLGQLEGDVAGEVAEVGVGRALDVDGLRVAARGSVEAARRKVRQGALPRGFDGLADLGSQTGGSVGSHSRMVAEVRRRGEEDQRGRTCARRCTIRRGAHERQVGT